MTRVEIVVGGTAGLPDAKDFAGVSGRYACADGAGAFAVLRQMVEYGYDHPGTWVTLVCADEAAARAYRFEWNMWYAERKPD